MTSATSRPTHGARRFLRDERGVVAIMFGLLLLPLIGAIGLAIDFGNVMTVRTKAQMAADAAALQAAGVAREIIKESDGSDASTKTAIVNAKSRAIALFTAHAQQSNLKTWTIDVQVVRTGQAIQSTAYYTVASANFISKVFGKTAFAASGSATSSASLPSFSDVYLALDISGSMGIASNNAEMVKLYNAKGKRSSGGSQPLNCVFACHAVEGGWSESFSAVASRLGIQLRIDVLRDAVLDMISTAEDDADSAPIYRLGLYTMGATADASTWSLNQLSGLTNNFGYLRTMANTIDIATPPNSAPQKQNSYINEQLASAAPMVTQSYDGSSQAKSKKYIFIITDGLRDVPSQFGSCTNPPRRNYGSWGILQSGRCTNAIDPAVCKTFKDKGITVGVLYTTYMPIPDNANNAYNKTSNYNQWFGFEVRDNPLPNSASALVYDRVQPALKECSSPGWFYEASDDIGITKAMANMFAQTTAAPSLTD